MAVSQRRVRVADVECAVPAPLIGADSHRLLHVLRLSPGDELMLFDGRGRSRPARIAAIAAGEVRLQWTGPVGEPTVAARVEIAAAIPKGRRVDVMVEKLTELGVARYSPLLTERGVVRPEAGGGKVARWQAIAEEASRQCRRDDVMEVAAPRSLADWLAGIAPGTVLHHAHPAPDAAPVASLRCEPGAGPRAFAVGPEGGWTDAELAGLSAAGSRALQLGPRILRVETAAIVVAVCALVASD